MYHNFFSIKRNPFSMTPDPNCVLWTRRHREAAAGLTYGILHRKGMMVLTGRAGTGKSTLLGKVLQSIPEGQYRCSVILNPTATAQEFLEMVLLDFGFDSIPESKAQRLWLLQKFLLDNHAKGCLSVLAIDEAHKLSHELLEEVRLLGNFDLLDEKLLQIVMLGQEELDDILNRDSLCQLKQRIAVRLRIDSLDEKDVEGYLQLRWRMADGALPVPFSEAAITEIARYSGCVPRLINCICDNSLMLAFADESRVVSAEHVIEVCRDLFLSPPAPLAKVEEAVSSPEPVPQVQAEATSPVALQVPAEPAELHLPPPIAFHQEKPLPVLEGMQRYGKPSLLTRWFGAFKPRRAELEKL